MEGGSSGRHLIKMVRSLKTQTLVGRLVSIVYYRERKGSLFEEKDISPRLRDIRRVLKKSKHARHCV